MRNPKGQDPAPGVAALRAEHDALALRLEVRTSIDCLRAAAQRLFVGLLCAGLAVKLAWDRWGALEPGIVRKAHPGPPLFFIVATICAVALLALAIRALVRGRRLMREEDGLFARYRQLRADLGLDA
jgi:hypothetical protein